MRTTTCLVTAAATFGLLAGCGSSDEPTAKAASFEEALGLDQASLQAREAKVQEAVRACMKDQGFDYIPVDPSQSGMQIRMGGPGSEDPAKLRKEGYGIADIGDREPVAQNSNDDPNQAIRERLSEADRAAYERALFGKQATSDGEGGFTVRRVERAGPAGGEGPAEDEGCFGKAQREVPGGPRDLGDQLEDMREEINNDTRLVAVNRAWSECMAESGYDWESPSEIIEYLFGQMQKALGGEGNDITVEGEPDHAAIAEIHTEEMAIAEADADCREETDYQKISKKVREEAQQRFLDEHPNLGK